MIPSIYVKFQGWTYCRKTACNHPIDDSRAPATCKDTESKVKSICDGSDYTHPKTNMDTQNSQFWKEIHFKTIILGIYVRFRGGGVTLMSVFHHGYKRKALDFHGVAFFQSSMFFSVSILNFWKLSCKWHVGCLQKWMERQNWDSTWSLGIQSPSQNGNGT